MQKAFYAKTVVAEVEKELEKRESTPVPLRKDRSNEELIAAVKDFKATLSERYVGREEEVKVLLLGLVSAMPVLFVGDPGTAKSAIVRDAASLVDSKDKYFEYQLNKYTDPSELFGPIDIIRLKEESVYGRITKGKLPEAKIAYLDEIFNANSSVLNTLLSILQERIFYDGYVGKMKVPLHTVISATNNIPEEPELAALYDRLLIRHHVEPVSEDKYGDLLKKTSAVMFAGPKTEEDKVKAALKPLLSIDELERLKSMLQPMDEVVMDEYVKIRKLLEAEAGIKISDRRFVQAQLVIAANAILNGRTKPEVEDLIVLKYIAPTKLEDFKKVEGLLMDELQIVEKAMENLTLVQQNLLKMFDTAKKSTKRVSPEKLQAKLTLVKDTAIEMAANTKNEAAIAKANEIAKQIDEFLKDYQP